MFKSFKLSAWKFPPAWVTSDLASLFPLNQIPGGKIVMFHKEPRTLVTELLYTRSMAKCPVLPSFMST